MKEDYRQLLRLDIINSVSGLSLISRVIVDGYLSGLNKSLRVGAGMEFSQYRAYEPGDDLRLLDWKMLARSGRYYIKQSEVDTHIDVKFIIDASASMLHEENDILKSQFANVMIASLAHIAQRQGDAISLIAVNNKKLVHLPPATSKQHFNRFLYELLQVRPNGKWPTVVESHKIPRKGQKELIFIFTDFYESALEITDVIKQFKNSHNEVIIFHLLGRKELEFDYPGQVVFEDLETGLKTKVHTKEAKATYVSALNQSITSIRGEMLANGIQYNLFTLDNDIGDALRLFLKHRTKLL